MVRSVRLYEKKTARPLPSLSRAWQSHHGATKGKTSFFHPVQPPRSERDSSGTTETASEAKP
jgi:hypothetical protein